MSVLASDVYHSRNFRTGPDYLNGAMFLLFSGLNVLPSVIGNLSTATTNAESP
jgi:hypothetical protein